MVGSLERIFRRVLRDNAKKIGGKLLCPICKSMTNPKDEPSALYRFFNEMQNLGKRPLSLKIPDNLKNTFGVFGGKVIVNTFKTHSKTAWFDVSVNVRHIGAETSDIVFLVTHEYLTPRRKALVVDEKISFFQAKVEKNNRLFEIKSRQWYLMRYWPKFSYKKKEFNLISCRRVPDICSFYLLILKRSTFNDSIFYDRARISDCRINSLSVSTPFMEERMPGLGTLSDDELAKKKRRL